MSKTSRATGDGGVQSSTRVTFRAGLVSAMGLLAVAYVAALALHATGDTDYVWARVTTGSVPFLLADGAMDLLLCPLMLATLAVAVRRRGRGLVSSVRWDWAVGSLGVAEVLAVLPWSPIRDRLASSSKCAGVRSLGQPRGRTSWCGSAGGGQGDA